MPFQFEKTNIEGIYIIEPQVFYDDRGFFMETYKNSDFVKAGIGSWFLQDNVSKSTYGVLRGLHYQREDHAQAKLVYVIRGRVWGVVVDLRKGSSTYLQWFGTELSDENHTAVYIPAGFAHGFVTLSDEAFFVYKCSAEYNREAEDGLRWNDPDLRISWPLPEKDIIVSEKDAVLPLLRDLGADLKGDFA